MRKIFPDKYEADDGMVDPEIKVFKNTRGIIDKEKLELAEIRALASAYEILATEFTSTHTFIDNDIHRIHKTFLGDIYDWAGKYRTVDLSSKDIRWCHARFIESEMGKFSELLSALTPFSPELSRVEILERLAKIHGELIVVHPFRDGNGRATRIFCDLLLMQAERRPLNTKAFYEKSVRKRYHKAIQKVWSQVDYSELTNLLDELTSA